MIKNRVPWRLFVLIAIGALLASGIYVGIMSVEGISGMRMVQSVDSGILGLIMFWCATHRQ